MDVVQPRHWLCRGICRLTSSRLALMTLLGVVGVHSVHADSMDPKILARVQAATFEVVAAKPVDDNLVYEKPLPLDLLPFQERNDKYYSVGTAFAKATIAM